VRELRTLAVIGEGSIWRKDQMKIKAKVRGGRLTVYLPHNVYQRVTQLISQGAYASGVVTTCLEKSLPSVEREMKRQTAAEKRNQQTQR
jgi:hypothetical protein